MRTNTYRLIRGVALVFAVSAIAAPIASAARVEQILPNGPGEELAYTGPVESPLPAPESSAVANDGFDWGDAGIGATAMLALAAIAAGAAVAVTHRPGRRHTIA